MIFAYLDTFSVIVGMLFLFLGCYLLFRIYVSQRWKFSLIYLGVVLVCIVLSLLGPRGGISSQNFVSQGKNIVFLIDVSTSMNAFDFENESISRLDAVKHFISQYVNIYSNNRYALDVFSGDAIKLLPFTRNTSIYQTVLSGVNESSTAKPGTDIVGALTLSASHFQDDDGGLIVLFTDGGEDDISNISELSDIFNEKNIKTLIVGVGSKSGSHIPVGSDFWGRVVYKTYKGKKVITKLNADQLENLATTLGKYSELDTMSDIKNISNQIHTYSDKIIFKTDINQRKSLTGLFIMMIFLSWCLFLGGLLFSKSRKN